MILTVCLSIFFIMLLSVREFKCSFVPIVSETVTVHFKYKRLVRFYVKQNFALGGQHFFDAVFYVLDNF